MVDDDARPAGLKEDISGFGLLHCTKFTCSHAASARRDVICARLQHQAQFQRHADMLFPVHRLTAGGLRDRCNRFFENDDEDRAVFCFD